MFLSFQVDSGDILWGFGKLWLREAALLYHPGPLSAFMSKSRTVFRSLLLV